MTAFAALIRTRRLELGKTQKQIADAIGIKCPDFVCLVEQGRRRLHLNRLPRLAEALELDLAQLWQLLLATLAPELAAALQREPEPGTAQERAA